MKYKPGTRVAVLSADAERFLGYGVYVGDEDCPPLREWLAREARKLGCEITARRLETGELKKLNPKIRLDNGTVVWGCECWWGDAETFVKRGAAKKMGVAPPTGEEGVAGETPPGVATAGNKPALMNSETATETK